MLEERYDMQWEGYAMEKHGTIKRKNHFRKRPVVLLNVAVEPLENDTPPEPYI